MGRFSTVSQRVRSAAEVDVEFEDSSSLDEQFDRQLDQAGVGIQIIPTEDLILRERHRKIDPQKVDNILASARKSGIIIPLIARPHPTLEGKFELLSGGHRRQVCVILNEGAPTRVIEVNDQEAAEISAFTNSLQHQLSPVEETNAILEVLSTIYQGDEAALGRLKQVSLILKRKERKSEEVQLLEELQEIFSRITRLSVSTFTRHYLPLLDLDEEIRDAVDQGLIKYNQAHLIQSIGLDELLDLAIEHKLPVRTLKNLSVLEEEDQEELVEELKNGKITSDEFEQQLREIAQEDVEDSKQNSFFKQASNIASQLKAVSLEKLPKRKKTAIEKHLKAIEELLQQE